MSARSRHALLGGALLVLVISIGAGRLDVHAPRPQEAATPTSSTPSEISADVSELQEQVAQLPVGPLTPPMPYDREEFGQRWADVDRTGCDQRNESLALSMTEISYRAGTHDCVVASGTFHDVYDGATWTFTKSQDGGGVQIDHVVPLAHAWEMGAAAWTQEQRQTFANDLTNLQATAGTYNASKGSRTPLEWLPADTAYQCTYLQRWAQIKTTWNLAVTEPERSFLSDRLTTCGS